jgi:uncharacterized protein
VPGPELKQLTRLRIYIGEDDTCADDAGREQPLYEAIALRARDQVINGLTIGRGIVGFGPGSHRDKIVLRRSEDRPITIDVIDTEENIETLLRAIEGLIGSGLAVTDKVAVRRYGPSQKA